MRTIGRQGLEIADFEAIVFQQENIAIHSQAIQDIENNHQFLIKFCVDKVIYGINTGFGPMAQYKIDSNAQTQLQYNLIRSHAVGTGEVLPEIFIRAALLARLNTLLQAHSGVHKDAVEQLAFFINQKIYPIVFEHGSVGASGDLVQLAHLALGLIGEGEVIFQKKILSTNEVLASLNRPPMPIHLREGLSLINGTSFMTGIALTNLVWAKNLLKWSIAASSLLNELVESYDDHFSEALNQAKKHHGQVQVASEMRKYLKDSKLIKKREEHLFAKNITQDYIKEKVQEYYSLRCVPQILGAVWDTLDFSEKILCEELNSVNDNPVIIQEIQNVLHGGNFHGDYVALEMDKIKIAITKLAMLSERQLNFMLNDKINDRWKPFANLGKLGLNFGMQAAQFTATSTTAECQTLAMPCSIHSIPCNNDNQDIVSMGTNAALLTSKVIENAYQILAIQFMTFSQLLTYVEDKTKLAPESQKIAKKIQQICPAFIYDEPKYKAIQNVKLFLKNNKPTD